jgi:hypothetical protein
LKARLLADADLRFGIVHGLQVREPAIDFLAAQGIIPESMPDPEVLALAAMLGRVLVSHDRKTMPNHFYRFLERRESPGLILLPQALAIGQAIEELHVVWACGTAEEFRNRVIYLPLRSGGNRRTPVTASRR